MDEEVRARFHEQANTTHRLEARVLVLEGDVEVLAKDVEHAATMHHFQSLSELIELKLQMMTAAHKASSDALTAAHKAASEALKEEIALLKRPVYGLLAVIVVAVIAAVMRGVLR